MGARITYGTAGATGGGWSAQPGTLQPAYEELIQPSWWSFQARKLATRRDPMRYFTMWSFGCKIGYGSPSGGDGAADGDMTLSDWFNPPVIQDGCQSLKWLKGMCVDTTDAPLSGVNVTAFRSSDNANVGYTVQSREDGSYDVPSPYVGVAHHVDAYLPGSPDRGGVTADTLIPTNIDGS